MVQKAQNLKRHFAPLALIIPAFLFLNTSCDPQRKGKCEWYLLPNPKANQLMEPGWVSLCVGNFKLGKQRCYFTAKPDFVEKYNGVSFKYNEMKYTKSFPRKITKITPCKKD